MREVAITGAGIICALGHNAREVEAALCAGASGIGPIQSVSPDGLRFKQGAEVKAYREEEHFAAGQLPLLDRFAQFALIAAREAIRESGFSAAGERLAKVAVITGSSIGGQSTQDASFDVLYRQGRERVHPLSIARTMANAGACHIAMEFGFMGPAFTVSSACASAAHAIGLAAWMVRSGMADAAITGGSEAPFSPGFLRAWDSMRVISSDTCRPFSRNRSGMILGEGAAMFVLEPAEAARARGARIHGYLAGFGMSSDAHHITQPNACGSAAAMRAALADAGIGPEQVGYINAHGTGTAANDPAEAAAIHAVFGERAASLAVSSTKAMHGHALGAAGAVEAFATLVALRGGVLPPTVNFTEPDPECALDVVPNQARRMRVEFALSNSFAFGGLNAVLAMAAEKQF